jgi:hypothetical protein
MNRIFASAIILSLVAVLSGCTFKPELLRAESTISGSEVVVTASLRSSDARTIKTRQLYFSLVTYECQGDPEGFPAAPYIQGERASTFKFPITGEAVEIVGRVPMAFFSEIKEPCLLLQGGGYFTGKILSAPAPIVPVGAGSNYSLKRTNQSLRD